MGTRGPVPKRSDQRRRRNADSKPDVVQPSGDVVKAPPLRGAKDMHPVAVQWYRSLAKSGQAQFYEPSDWAQANLIAIAIDSFCQKPSAMMLSSVLSGASSLLATEGDRRRMRVELAQVEDDSDAAAVAVLDDYRDALGAG